MPCPAAALYINNRENWKALDRNAKRNYVTGLIDGLFELKIDAGVWRRREPVRRRQPAEERSPCSDRDRCLAPAARPGVSSRLLKTSADVTVNNLTLADGGIPYYAGEYVHGGRIYVGYGNRLTMNGSISSRASCRPR